jgi:hypothetical protein
MQININSGFKSGGRLVKWDGRGFELIRRVHDCTWAGDADDSALIEVPDDFRGAVVLWREDGHTPVARAELLGFSDSELTASAPVSGWAYSRCGCNAATYRRMADYGQYLRALAENGGSGILTDAAALATARQFGGGLAVAEIPYEWGDQAAAHFAVFRDGQYVAEAAGCGDNAPYLTAAGEIRWPSEDRAEFEHDCEALDRRLAQDHGAWLRESYARRQNPLPGLRKRVGGVWEFARPNAPWQQAESPCGEISIPGVGRVRWTPAQ